MSPTLTPLHLTKPPRVLPPTHPSGLRLRPQSQSKIRRKTQKYQPLLEEPPKDRDPVSLVCAPIGHASTLLAETADHLALALATRRPQGSGKATGDPATDRHALSHDRKLANTVLQQLSDLAATRLLRILAHKQTELQNLEQIALPPFALPKRRTDPSSTSIT